MIWLPGKARIWPGVAWQLSSTVWHAECLVATLPKRQFLRQRLLELPYLFFVAIDLGRLSLQAQLKVAAWLLKYCTSMRLLWSLELLRCLNIPNLVFGRRRVLGWW